MLRLSQKSGEKTLKRARLLRQCQKEGIFGLDIMCSSIKEEVATESEEVVLSQKDVWKIATKYFSDRGISQQNHALVAFDKSDIHEHGRDINTCTGDMIKIIKKHINPDEISKNHPFIVICGVDDEHTIPIVLYKTSDGKENWIILDGLDVYYKYFDKTEADCLVVDDIIQRDDFHCHPKSLALTATFYNNILSNKIDINKCIEKAKREQRCYPPNKHICYMKTPQCILRFKQSSQVQNDLKDPTMKAKTAKHIAIFEDKYNKEPAKVQNHTIQNKATKMALTYLL